MAIERSLVKDSFLFSMGWNGIRPPGWFLIYQTGLRGEKPSTFQDSTNSFNPMKAKQASIDISQSGHGYGMPAFLRPISKSSYLLAEQSLPRRFDAWLVIARSIRTPSF